jgi:CubicO group peptidase (beta-lactamase class C family)
MAKDALFRMASSTKPVAAVAAMLMIEEGKIRPSDEVHKFIPEFKGMKVAVQIGDDQTWRTARGADRELPEYKLVPANREIIILDLLTHTSGLMSGGLGSAIAGRLPRGPDDTLATYIPKLGEVPLDFQPGTRWSYGGSGINTMGRIVEIVSGQPFDEYLQQRIFEPLGMKDTFYNVPEDRRSRLVTIVPRPGARARKRTQTGVRKYFSGSSGLVSTAEDYLRFEQMLCNGGELLGNRLLTPKMVEMMASNQVGDIFHGLYGNQEGLGFGYMVAVVLDVVKSGSRRSKGAIGWGGAYGTMSWTDFKEDLTGVIMLQQPRQQVKDDFEKAVRQAIIE